VKKQKYQSGFSHLLILTIILGLALVGTLGFVFYQNFIVKKDDSSKTLTTNSNKKSDSTTTDKTVAEPKNTFKIPELGIKGIYNGAHPINYDMNNKTYSLLTKTLAFIDSSDIPASCGASGEYRPGVAKIARYAPDDDATGVSLNGGTADPGYVWPKASEAYAVDEYTNLRSHKHVGNYYYYLVGSAQACPNASDEALQESIFNDVWAYFKTIEAIK
jgi:hypothetical protein